MNDKVENKFIDDIQCVINKHCKENGSDTPDFILACYLSACLENFNMHVNAREEWYGRKEKPTLTIVDKE